jgi:AcrR family transcriptional regulator
MAGRPRSRDLDVTLTEVTAQLLGEVGYAATTVDAIAARSGAPKSTLYRRWSSKAELVFAAIVHGADITVPDTGSLASDLAELARRIVAALEKPSARLALPGLLADLASDPQLMQRFHDNVVGAQRALVQLILDRAADRGDPHVPVSAADLHAQLLGTAYAWIFLVGEAAPHDLPERLAGAARALLTPWEAGCSTTSCPGTSSPSGTSGTSTPQPTPPGQRSPH